MNKNFRKSAKSWEIGLKVQKVWESVQKPVKVKESVLKVHKLG